MKQYYYRKYEGKYSLKDQKFLEDIFRNFLNNIKPKYRIWNTEVFIGESSSLKVDAVVNNINGGTLILINKGLIESFKQWVFITLNLSTQLAISGNQFDEAYITRIANDISNSLDNYITKKNLPNFRDLTQSDPHNRVLFSIVYSSVMFFIIAHEYSHVLLGHIDKLSKQLNKDLINQMDIDADRVAIDILLTSDLFSNLFENKYSNFLKQNTAIGILVASKYLQILDAKRAAITQSMQSMKTVERYGSFKDYLELQYPNAIQSPFYKPMLKVFSYIFAAVIWNDKNISFSFNPSECLYGLCDTSSRVKIQRCFYYAYKRNDRLLLERIISLRPDLFKEMVSTSFIAAKLHSGSFLSSSFTNWTFGESMDVCEWFEFALTIRDILKTKHNVVIVTNDSVQAIGIKILKGLQETQIYFGNKHDSISMHSVNNRLIRFNEILLKELPYNGLRK